MTMKDSDIKSVLITEEQLAAKVAEMGAQISKDYQGRKLIILGVLKGSVVFMSDLIRSITVPVEMDFMAVSSYGAGVKTSGVVKILKDLDRLIAGYDVLVVEDILDSGMTLSYLTELLRERDPASIRIATLLDKPDRRKVDIKPDYVGFTIPDEFVVGYGLDYAELYRNLPYVGILSPSVYESNQ
ncbi:MAG: hypoxanthine phosphoribosyltransferase [Angelakisella sp.]|jgi:hypoxanthine phosphoribosyltransferase|nr:hypoxanthine phosphoribosyltransferase [Angelakisella sp.]